MLQLRTRIGRLGRLPVALVVLGLVAAACGTADPDSESGGSAADEPQRGGSLTVGVEAETNSWLPGEAVLGAGLSVALSFYDPLMARNAEGVVQPFLAESMEPNEDFTEWVLTLRPGVKFHDGTDLTAEVLKINFDEYLRADNSRILGRVFEIDQVEVVDKLTVRYLLKQPNATFPELLTVDSGIGLPFSVEAARRYGEDAGSHPVGTGPFVLESWTRDSQLVVTRNEDYWWPTEDGPPYLDEIIFRVIPDEDTALASLQAGDIDAFSSVDGSIIRRASEAAGDGSLNVIEYAGNNGSQIIFNTLVPPVDDVRVRQGLAFATDQEVLIDVLGNTGVSSIKTQYYGESSPWYSEAVADAWPGFDPEAAQGLLDEYVADPERSDGKPPGSPITVELEANPTPVLNEFSQTVQALWQDVGVEVELNAVDQAVHFQNVIGGVDSTPPFVGSYVTGYWRDGQDSDPYTVMTKLFNPPAQSATNFTNFYDDVVTEQVAILGASADYDERFAAMETLGLHFAEQLPNLWAGSTPESYILSSNVMGLDSWTFPDGSPGFGATGYTEFWGQVWLAEG